MFLRQVYSAFIGNAQVNGQLLDEEHGKVVVLCEQSHQAVMGIWQTRDGSNADAAVT